MEDRRFPSATRTEVTDYEFGQGTSVLIENEINKRLLSLRANPFDGYLYTKLEISSRILLGKPALKDEEYVEIVRLKSDEWQDRKQNKSFENFYLSALTALEYYLLTGRDIASKEELKELKKEVEPIARLNHRTLFESSNDVSFDADGEDYMSDNDIFLNDNLIKVAELGLIARYLGLDSIDGKFDQIIKALETQTKNVNFKYMFNTNDDKDSILIMKRMADIILIKDHITKV